MYCCRADAVSMKLQLEKIVTSIFLTYSADYQLIEFFYEPFYPCYSLEHDIRSLMITLISSKLFWFYIENTSKPYGSSYFSLSKNYIKNFGIYDFTSEEKGYIRRETDKQKLDEFFEKKYLIHLDTGLKSDGKIY